LRIGLAVGASSVTLGGDGELFVTDDGNGQPIGSIPAGVAWTVVPDTGGLRLVPPGGSPTERHAGISAVSVTENRFAMVSRRRYRGRVNVVRAGSGLTVMNRVPVESYLAGVLGGEIGIRRAEEAQALVAQAVVSRSFALKNRGRWEALGFDAWADVRDQVYNGVSGETPEVWSAVRRTTGEVLEYDGEIIEAYFHSTCGGSTAAAEEAFKAARGRPYLRPISDASGGGHHYCDLSPRFRWREEWDGTKLRSILSRTRPPGRDRAAGGDGLQRITDVAVTGTGPSGRVTELRIVWECARPGRPRRAAAGARSAVAEHGVPAVRHAAGRSGHAARRGGYGIGTRPRAVSMGCDRPSARGTGLPQDSHDLFSGDSP